MTQPVEQRVAAPESDFDDLAVTAALIAGARAAVIALPRGGRQWFRGIAGVITRSAPGPGSLAEFVANGPEMFEVRDAADHPQLFADVLFRSPEAFTCAVGFSLRAPDGQSLGALLILGDEPLLITDLQVRMLRTLARQIVVQLEMRRVSARALATERRLEAVEARHAKLAANREAALAESEQRLRITIENSPVGFALVGLDGSWLQVNEAMASMVGYAPDQLMKLTFQDITHPDDLAGDLALLAELNAGTRLSYQMDKRYFHADGHVVWASLTASIVRRRDGTPLYYVSQVEDITERRQATDELHAERDLSAALLGALQDGYAYLEHGCIMTVNEVFCHLTGLGRDKLIGRTAPFTFITGDSGRNEELLRTMVNDKSGNGELVLERPDGSRVDVGIQIRPVRHTDGRVRGYVALVRDITDRKLREQRLRHRADHDGLTGLLNRAAFHIRLTERVAAAHASGAPLTLAILDLDRFKAVNDEHGHPAGDAVLAEFADRLRGNARGDDAIGRIGGEEFGWLMSETGREEAIGALSRTLDAVRRHPFPHGGQLTFSAGVAQLRTFTAGPDEPEGFVGETAPALVQRTDRLLYLAKAGGRDGVVAAPELDPLSPSTFSA